MDIPVTNAQNSIKRFLKTIQDAGVPQTKVNGPYLKSAGYRSGKDLSLIPIFKALGFLGADGLPTKRWRDYRSKQSAPRVLAAGIHEAYPALFAMYPDAQRKDNEAIVNWIRSNSDYDLPKVNLAVTTFRTLCDAADFDGADTLDPTPEGKPQVKVNTPEPTLHPQRETPPGVQSININIQLHLPLSDDGVSYQKLFEAMRKYLFDNG